MTNNFNYEELRNALVLIQNVCQETETCEVCPFGNDNGECCIVEGSPHEWTFIDPVPVIRLLK